jgi:antirestriction protein ArdC
MADFDDMITAVGAELVHGGNRACYMHAPRDLIKMPFFNQFPSADDYYAVLAHELTHWTGAKSRCDRKFGKRFGDSNYAFEELVAELGGAFLCAEYGIDHTSQAAAYMETWLRGMKDHPQMIVSAASLASKALEFIRAEVLAHNEPEALPELPTIQAPGAPAPQMALSL